MAFSHPYIPNASEAQRTRLLGELGLSDVEALFDAIPSSLRLKRSLNLPAPLRSEHELRRSVERRLQSNLHCEAQLNFLGAGCYQHVIPAVCDEIARRGEFLTAYGGRQYSDHGKFQAMFEFQSLMGELLDLDVVSTPTYDGGCAAGSALLMACRVTGRKQILLPTTVSADRLTQITGFTSATAEIIYFGHDPESGLIDLKDLAAKISNETAVVYFETPSFLGTIQTHAQEIIALAHRSGALAVTYADPISLGVLETPARHGADIVVGDVQCLGNQMFAGGGLAGFIATRDDPRLVAELPTFLVSMVRQKQGSGFGFSLSTMERTSYEKREAASDYYGTTQWLWGIVAGVYLSLMGPKGMVQVGRAIAQRSHYAARRLSTIKGVRAPRLTGPFFKEFVVTFEARGFSVQEINERLLEEGIFGGHDLGALYPELGNSALYCTTEVHNKEDIDRLADTLGKVLR